MAWTRRYQYPWRSKLVEGMGRRDRNHAPMTSKDAVNDPEFQMTLEKQLDQETCIEHAFPAEDEAERVDELGVLDDPAGSPTSITRST